MVGSRNAAALTALLMIGSAVSAEPPKVLAVKQSVGAPPASPRAEIALASAHPVRTPDADVAPSIQSPKRRIEPRVTSCRCGDPQGDPETQEQ